MADNVQFIMDRMAGTFRQMEEQGIFTSGEVKSIVSKRTDFEYVLKRRQLTVGDYYKYLQYEVNLEKLLTLRCEKDFAGKHKAAKSRQDALRNLRGAAVRHICTVFERGIRRYPDELDLVLDYVNFLKERKSNNILNEVFGRALALHPKNEDLWLQAAVHELEENNNVHAARVLLQTALRANKTSQKMWTKYFELELWNAARMSERKEVLQKKDKAKKGYTEDAMASKDTGTGEEEGDADQAGLIAAPSVVFKHALQAVPSADLACAMHTACTDVSEPLATSIESHMKIHFGAEAATWKHLFSLSLRSTGAGAGERSEAAVELCREWSCSSSPKGKGKGSGKGKKRGTASPGDEASAIAVACAQSCLSVFQDFEGSAAGDTHQGKSEAVSALCTLAKMIRASGVLSGSSEPAQQALRSVASRVRAALEAILPSDSHDKGLRSKALLIQKLIGTYLLDCVDFACPRSTSPSKKRRVLGQARSDEPPVQSFLGLLGDTVPSLVQAGASESKADEDFLQYVTAWLQAVQAVGEDIGLMDPGEGDEDEDEDKEGEDEDQEGGEKAGHTSPFVQIYGTDIVLTCRDKLHDMICEAAPALVSVEEGHQALALARTGFCEEASHMDQDKAEKVGNAMRRAMTSRACKVNFRGSLCAAYVSWVEHLARGGFFGGAPGDCTAELAEAHKVVEREVLKRPHLLVHANMGEYFRDVSRLALDNCRHVLADDQQSNIFLKSSKHLPCLDFARAITEAAVQQDDQSESFWAARAEVETMARDPQAVNQVRNRSHSRLTR